MNIKVIQGDILAQDVDAIVNPANSFLRHGGGLARLIADAAAPERTAGPEIKQWSEDHITAPLIATGDAYATSAGLLPFKHVIHAVGPIWGGGNKCEPQLLMEAHMSSLNLAYDLGVQSISFPAISCGIFGYPVEKAAYIALTAAHAYSFMGNIPDEVRFVLFTDEHYDAYSRAYREVILNGN